MHLLIIVAFSLKRAHLTSGYARFAYRAPARDQIQVEGIVEVGANERFEDFVRLLAGGALRNRAELLGHSKYMRVNRKRGRYVANVYGIWRTCSGCGKPIWS